MIGEQLSSTESLPLPPADLPGLADVAEVIAGLTGGRLEVLGREPNPYASGSPSEILTCRQGRGRELMLLCKYQAAGDETWSDVAYEAEVYRRVLQPLAAGAPHYYGAHRERGSGRTWLLLEYLDGSLPLDELGDPEQVIAAASWLGRFHAAGEAQLARAAPSFLKGYGGDFYLAAARRAEELEPRLAGHAARFAELAGFIFDGGETVVHGDFHPANVLARGGAVYPVDWEMAGRCAGEMDLTSLIAGWPEVEPECARAYCEARWPSGAPANFQERLNVAWLAYYFSQLSRAEWGGNLEGLRAAGVRVGIGRG
jgi:hypothetical protein